MATTLEISTNRLNMDTHSPRQDHTAESQAFSSRAGSVHLRPRHLRMRGEPIAARDHR